MKLRTLLSVGALSLFTGCIVVAPPPKNPPPNNPPPTATTVATAEPTATTAPTATAAPTNTVAATATVATPVGTVGASGEISWGNWVYAGAAKPTATCVPESKKDLCWDGVDNNCNGEIDEGCPYKTGVLQFIIAWKAGVDLDLHVVGPDGREVNWKNRELGNGLYLDKDCHGVKDGKDDCEKGKVENIYFETGKPVLKGRYKVWVEMFDNRGQWKEPTIPFTFGGRAGTHTFTVPFAIANQKGTKLEFSFEII